MAVYRDIDLQQYKLEPQLSLLRVMVQADTSRFDITDLLGSFHSEILVNSQGAFLWSDPDPDQ